MNYSLLILSLFSLTCFGNSPRETYEHLHNKYNRPIPREPVPPTPTPSPVVNCLEPGKISYDLELFLEESTCYHWEYNDKMKEALNLNGVEIEKNYLFQVDVRTEDESLSVAYLLYFSTVDQVCKLSYSAPNTIENIGTDIISSCYFIHPDYKKN